jgi:hypothetical protein
MSDFPLRLGTQIQSTLQLVRLSQVWVPLVTGFVALIVSMLIVPGDEPSIWNWFGLPLIACCIALAIFAIIQRQAPRRSTTARNDLTIIATVSLAIATTLSAFTTLEGTAVLLIGTVLLAALAIRTWRARPLSVVLCGTVAILVPIWTWLALDASTAGLLLLFPLGFLAWFADRQMLLALNADTSESSTNARSFRFVSWLSLLAATILTTLLAVSGDVNNAWAVVGTLGALACIGAEVGLPQHASLPGIWSRQLIATGFAWLGICWLTSL